MRLITELFTIQSEQLVFGHSVDGFLYDSPPTTIEDATRAYREALGSREGENRIALFGRPVRSPAPKDPHLKVLSSAILIERPPIRT